MKNRNDENGVGQELLVRAFVPFFIDGMDPDFTFRRKEAVLLELRRLTNSIDLCNDILICRGSRSPRIEAIPLSRCPAGVRRHLSRSLRVECGAIILRVTVKCIIPNDLDRHEVSRKFAAEVQGLLYGLILAANVAKPGSFEVGEGMIFCGKQWVYSTDQVITDLQFAEQFTQEYQWPPIRELPLNQVLSWHPFIGNRETTGVRTGKLARGLHALSYAFGELGADSEVSVLMYALVGLEALYTDSHDGIAEQVSKRAQVLLGELKNFKKALKQMYNIRSRFIHGDLDFPPSFVPFMESSYTTEYQEVENSANLAVMVLLATLQEMCSRGLHELSFKLSVAQ